MSRDLLESNQNEARNQVQQALDGLYLIWKRQNECSRAMFAAKQSGIDDIPLRHEMYRLCRHYIDQDDKYHLLEEVYRKRFSRDLEPFRTTINFEPG